MERYLGKNFPTRIVGGPCSWNMFGLADRRLAVRPDQNLWTLVRRGCVSEDDVDSSGRLRDSRVPQRDWNTSSSLDDLIEKYEMTLRRLDRDSSFPLLPQASNSTSPSSRPSSASEETRGHQLDELRLRIGIAEREICNLRTSLIRIGIPVRSDPYD